MLNKTIKTPLLVLLASCSQAYASVPPLYTPGSVPNNPSGGVIVGPIHPRAQVVQAGVLEPYGLLPAPTLSTLINQPIVEGDLYAHAIFLGQRWQTPAFARDKVVGLDDFLSGWDGSRYASVLGEYAYGDGSAGLIKPMRFLYSGYTIDPVPERQMNQGVEQLAENEICDGLATGQYSPVPGSDVAPTVPDVPRNFFVVYTSTRRRPTDACAVHSWHECTYAQGDVLFDYAVVYNTDGDAACDPGHSDELKHSEGLAASANSTARAIAEVFTDPVWYGWMDMNGDEVADKCAWQFDHPYVTLANGSKWRLQSLWSDAAYLTGMGHENFDGKRGCVDGF